MSTISLNNMLIVTNLATSHCSYYQFIKVKLLLKRQATQDRQTDLATLSERVATVAEVDAVAETILVVSFPPVVGGWCSFVRFDFFEPCSLSSKERLESAIASCYIVVVINLQNIINAGKAVWNYCSYILPNLTKPLKEARIWSIEMPSRSSVVVSQFRVAN